MQPMALSEAFAALGLRPAAGKDAIRQRFRELVKICHPDLWASEDATRRFIEIVQAYRVLELELNLRDPNEPRRRCARCGQYAELFEAADGHPGCADCLLGESRKRRFLPLPTLVTVRHWTVCACYTASVACAAAYLYSENVRFALTSIALSACGLLVLGATCLRVRDSFRPTREPIG